MFFSEDGLTKRNEMKNTSENINDDIPGSDDALIDIKVEGDHICAKHVLRCSDI
jgi:hypothetical protein